MSAERAIQRQRAHQHEHALERLRERYFSDADISDVIALRDLSAPLAKGVKPLPGSDVKQVFVGYRDRLVHVVYCPRYEAVRTVLPRQPNPFAQAIEARRADPNGSVHESAVGTADAPEPIHSGEQ